MTDTIATWKRTLDESKATLETFISQPEIWSKLEKFTNIVTETLRREGTLFSCGNGGSHCDSMHFSEEWTGRYRKNRKPLAALALGDASHTTCVSNDFG